MKLNATLNSIEIATLVDELQQELQKIVTTTMRMQINHFLENYKTIQSKTNTYNNTHLFQV